MDTNTLDSKDTPVINQVMEALGKVDEEIRIAEPDHGPSVAWLAQTIIHHSLQRIRELEAESTRMKTAIRNFNTAVGVANAKMLGLLKKEIETGIPSGDYENAVDVLKTVARGVSALSRDLEGVRFGD